MNHKVRISYTVELTPEQRRQCLRYADEIGLSYDRPRGDELLRRLFRQQGDSAVLSAIERGEP